MKLDKRFASILLLVGLLIGGLVAGIALTGNPAPAAAQSTDACVEDDDNQETDPNFFIVKRQFSLSS